MDNIYYLDNIGDYNIPLYNSMRTKCSLKHGTNVKCTENRIKNRRKKNKRARKSRRNNMKAK